MVHASFTTACQRWHTHTHVSHQIIERALTGKRTLLLCIIPIVHAVTLVTSVPVVTKYNSRQSLQRVANILDGQLHEVCYFINAVFKGQLRKQNTASHKKTQL